MRLRIPNIGPRRMRAFVIIAAATLVCAACGAGPAAGSAQAPPPKALDDSRPFGGDPAAEGTPVDGGTLNMGMYAEPVSFDPLKGNSEAASSIYDSLLKFDDNGQPQPYLAKSMTSPDNGTTWVLGLRQGVTFQDGTPLDAAAVIFNVQRVIDSKTAPGHAYTVPIKTMVATAPLTVTFTLSKQTGSFPSSFALPFSAGNLGSIASPAAVQKWGPDYGRHPVGAGPFSFVEWDPDSKVVVKKFPGYWQQGLPHLDGIVFHTLPDTETRYASVVNGDIDATFAAYQTEVYRSSSNPALNTYFGGGGGAKFLYFNLNTAPFDDSRMREAVIHAIDPKALSATQFSGAMDQALTAFAADSPDYSQQAADEYPTYDPAKAKELIAAYQKDGGNPNFTLSSSNSPTGTQLTTFLQAQFAAVGVTVKLNLVDITALSTQVVQAGNFQLTTWENGPWSSPFPYMSNIFRTGGSTNYAHYSNPTVDAALDDAVSTTDAAKQAADYQQAQVQINKDLPVAWLSRSYTATITQKNVRGIVRYLPGEVFWSTVWLAAK